MVRVHRSSTLTFLGTYPPGIPIRRGYPCGNGQPIRPPELLDPHQRFNLTEECRNINLLSIDYAFRPRLRIRLTLGGFTFPRKPSAFGDKDFHLVDRYSCRHTHFQTLHGALRHRFIADWNAPLPPVQARARGFGTSLIPDHFRRQNPRPVSYYALFKWWLLLSQHPGCLRVLTSLRTKTCLGTLSGGLGCSPFAHGYYHPQTDSHDKGVWYSEFGWSG